MKKLLFSVLAVCAFTVGNAQETGNQGQTSAGSWLIEANTGFGGGTFAHSANTGIGFTSVDGETNWAIGGEVGYFIMDDLALKIGMGYSSMMDGDLTAFSYKIGAKYYVLGNIPFQIDMTGASWKDADENPLWLGIQGGYAFFLGQNVSIEPGVRYNHSLNEDFYDKGLFEIRVGFAIHF